MSTPLKIFIVFFIAVSFLFFFNKKDSKFYPKPTETIVLDTEESSEGQSQREEWIESIHRAAPSDSWHKMEIQNQWQRYEKRQDRTSFASLRDGGTTDTIANGAVIGTWLEKGSKNQAGSVFDTEYDAETDKIWLLSAGGTLWRGNRDGSLWEVINQDLRFTLGTLRFLPLENGRRLIAKIGNLPHYSDDEGITWNASTGITISDGWGRTTQMKFMDDEQTIYCLSKPDYWANWRIYKSTDKGETYSQTNAYFANDGGENKVALCKPYNSDDLYYIRKTNTNSQFFFIDQDTDEAELLNTSNALILDRPNLVASASDNDIIFYAYSADNIVYKSTLFNEEWIAQGTIPETPWSVAIYLSPSNPEALFTGGVNSYRSIDGGLNWNLVNNWAEYYNDVEGKLHADIMHFQEFMTLDSQAFVLVSNHGGLSISFDHLSTTQNIGLEGLNVSQYYSVKSGNSNPNNIIAGAQDQGLQRGFDSNNGIPINFNQVISGDYGHVVFTNGGNSFWTVYPGGWVTYYDNSFSGGYTATYDVPGNDLSVWIPPLQESLNANENAIYVAGGNVNGGSGSHLIKLEYTGGNITASQFDYDFQDFSDGQVSSVEVSPLNSDKIYTATTNGRFFFTIDGGSNWEQNVNFVNEGHYLYGQTIYASKTDENIVYLGGSGYSNPPIYRSTNGGSFFNDFSEGLPPTLVFEITGNADESLLFAATEDGPYIYVAAEEKWFDMSGICAPSQTYWSAQYIESLNLVRFGTYGRGIWDFKLEEEEISGISNLTEAISFNVYPNPSTDFITVELPENTKEIHFNSLNGKRLKSFEATSNKLTIDLSDFDTGIYILSLNVDGKIVSEKIILE